MNWYLIAALTILLCLFGGLAIGNAWRHQKEQHNKAMDDVLRSQSQ